MACTSNGDFQGVIRIGLALRAKKLRRYATPGIVAQAASKGIELVPIGITASDIPLIDQGPFDAILHKLLPDDPFYAELESYCNAHPQVRVLDEFKHVNSIRNREGMLHALKEGIITTSPCALKESRSHDGLATGSCASSAPSGAHQAPVSCTYSAPKQVTISSGTSLQDIKSVLATSGISFPIMSKPLQADGSDGSHCISLFLAEKALEALINLDTGTTSEAFILQQFQEHNGVLYKCYVLGDLTEIRLRPSLHVSPAVEAATAASSGVLVLPRFSTTPLPATGSLILDAPRSRASHTSHESSHCSSELGSTDSHSQAPDSSTPTSHGALHAIPSEPHPPELLTETSVDSAEQLGVDEMDDEQPRSSLRASWPQLQELGRSVEALRPRKVRSRSGHAMVSWLARTGEGKEVQMEVEDPGERLEEFQRQRAAGGGHAADVTGAPWASMPPEWSIRQLAQQLQAKSGLRLFNLDVICPVGQAGQRHVGYRVVDINYFPGFDKLPQFEDKFVDFLVACGREAAASARACAAIA
eukprot:jgi/Ulvmu1/283/UM001_0287.1